MSPERWRPIEQVYHAALEREPPSRAAYVAEKCAGDASLMREVQSLLAHDPSDPNALLNQAALPHAGWSRLERRRRVGPYEIESLIGCGGMGEVYLARDMRLKRDVALKVLPPEFAGDPERMARLEREAHVLASLNHPNIAQIYGVESGGLAMKFVDGWRAMDKLAETLDARLRKWRPETAAEARERIAEVIELAEQEVLNLLDEPPTR